MPSYDIHEREWLPPMPLLFQRRFGAENRALPRRRTTRPSEEYRTPTDEEWDEFLGHFQRRKVSLGTCGRAYSTPCIHEHGCIRGPMLRPDPAQRHRLVELRDNLHDRIDEAHAQGWLGDIEELTVSLTAANDKLDDLDRLTTRKTTVHLGMPDINRLVRRSITETAPH